MSIHKPQLNKLRKCQIGRDSKQSLPVVKGTFSLAENRPRNLKVYKLNPVNVSRPDGRCMVRHSKRWKKRRRIKSPTIEVREKC